MSRILLLFCAAALLFMSCGNPDAENTVRIGCKNFTEQLILGEILAQLVERKTELDVERSWNLGGTMICHQALAHGEIDLYPEYTGTAIRSILKNDQAFSPIEAYEYLLHAYKEQFECEWFPPFGFNNSYALAVRGSEAEERGWGTISDLKNDAGAMQAGFTAEFTERGDGYPGLQERYGISFESVRILDPGLMYQAVSRDDVDVISGFSTDGRIAAYKLAVLEDDLGFFPPYEAAVVARSDVLKRHPQLHEVIQLLSGSISTETMQGLNYSVDEEGDAPAAVAARFLDGMEL